MTRMMTMMLMTAYKWTPDGVQRKWVKRVLSRLNTLLMTPAKNEVDVEVMMTMTSIKDSKEEVENVSVVTF